MLSIFGFGGYKDDKIMKQVNRAINAHPMLEKKKDLTITCNKGVVKLAGEAKSVQEKKRIEKAIRDKLEQSQINYDKIDNQLEI